MALRNYLITTNGNENNGLYTSNKNSTENITQNRNKGAKQKRHIICSTRPIHNKTTRAAGETRVERTETRMKNTKSRVGEKYGQNEQPSSKTDKQ